MGIMSCKCEDPQPKYQRGLWCVQCKGFIEENNEARNAEKANSGTTIPKGMPSSITIGEAIDKQEKLSTHKPCGDAEVGQCDMCGEESSLKRKYYRYDIKCNCCNSENDNHFEIVRFCPKCAPAPPQKVTVYLTPISYIP